MTKKKSFNDMGIYAISKEAVLFSDSQIDKISNRFGFSKDYPLGALIEDASYRFLTPPPEYSASTVRGVLSDLSKDANRLKTAIDKAGNAYQHIHPYLPPSFHLTQFKDNLIFLEAAIKAAHHNLEGTRTKPGTKKNWPYRGYIREMHAIYQKGTGRNDKYTRDAFTDEYKGPFLDFLEHCLTCIGHKKERGTLTSDIKDALQGS